MPRQRKRPPIPVRLSLPAEPPTQAEIDAITSISLSTSLMATDAIIGAAGRAGVVLILNDARSQKALRHAWDKQPTFAPVLRAWFPREVRKVRRTINHTWQTWGQRPLPHPLKKQKQTAVSMLQ